MAENHTFPCGSWIIDLWWMSPEGVQCDADDVRVELDKDVGKVGKVEIPLPIDRG